MYEINTVYNEDSYEAIKGIPDKSVDCIYTDIPYKMQSGGKGGGAFGDRVHKLIRREMSDIEYCLYFRESGVKLNDGYEIKSKWYVSPINKADKDEFEHPTIKPLELVKRHLLHATSEGDIVADFFLGSGTTCVAARELGRKYIGFEKDKEYYKIASDRMNGINKNGQTSIFTDFSLFD